jgi:1-acyl-sn-glycerol-3-phosphate acyltransferase
MDDDQFERLIRPGTADRPRMDDDQFERLIRANTADLLAALGLDGVRRGRPALEWLCRPAARRFADEIRTYEGHVGAHGLAAGAAWALRRHTRRVLVAGQATVPRQGPLLVVANHPGVTDTLALFASLPRPDLRVVATDRPFLRALTNTSRHLIYLSESGADRPTALRAAARYLRDGGAVLTFPGGQIEPDPALRPEASAALARWSDSIGVLVRLAPSLRVVPAVVSGVLSARAQRHPLTRLRRAQADRERLGAMLQILLPAFREVVVRVAFGPPLAGADLLAAGDAPAITQRVVDQTQRLIDCPPPAWQPLPD